MINFTEFESSRCVCRQVILLAISVNRYRNVSLGLMMADVTVHVKRVVRFCYQHSVIINIVVRCYRIMQPHAFVNRNRIIKDRMNKKKRSLKYHSPASPRPPVDEFINLFSNDISIGSKDVRRNDWKLKIVFNQGCMWTRQAVFRFSTRTCYFSMLSSYYVIIIVTLTFSPTRIRLTRHSVER